MKNQDIVVLAVLMKNGAEKMSYAELGKTAKISTSEAHASVGRLIDASLLNSERYPIKRNVYEFLVHGLRYVFPMKTARGLERGMPTAYAAPVAAEEFAVTGVAPVWHGSCGDVYGQAFDPIYPTAPEAAKDDPELYERLALFDMLRGGRLRERLFAEKKIAEMVS